MPSPYALPVNSLETLKRYAYIVKSTKRNFAVVARYVIMQGWNVKGALAT